MSKRIALKDHVLVDSADLSNFARAVEFTSEHERVDVSSDMSEMPGPAVAVIARAPAQLAPITMPSDAISSSACTIANVAFPVVLSTRYFFM